MISFVKKITRLDSYTAFNSIRYISREKEITGSQRRSLPKPSSGGGKDSSKETIMSEVHWTVRWKYQITIRQKMFVMETLILRMITQGETFGDYLLLSDLLFLNKEYSNNYHANRLIAYAEIILDSSMLWNERKELVCSLYRISGSDYRRIYGNLRKRWKPEDYLSIVQVPLETYIDQAPEGEPYSSYCKGYGEGSSRGQIYTPYSWELDGEEEPDEDQVNPEETRILTLISVIRSLLSNHTREKFKRGK